RRAKRVEQAESRSAVEVVLGAELHDPALEARIRDREQRKPAVDGDDLQAVDVSAREAEADVAIRGIARVEAQRPHDDPGTGNGQHDEEHEAPKQRIGGERGNQGVRGDDGREASERYQPSSENRKRLRTILEALVRNARVPVQVAAL